MDKTWAAERESILYHSVDPALGALFLRRCLVCLLLLSLGLGALMQLALGQYVSNTTA